MAKFLVETTVEIYSPKDPKFRFETTKWNWRRIFCFFVMFSIKGRLENEERQEEVTVEEEGIEEDCEIEGREPWRGWIFTVIAPNSKNLVKKVLLFSLGKLILQDGFESRLALIWCYTANANFLMFLNISLEKSK